MTLPRFLALFAGICVLGVAAVTVTLMRGTPLPFAVTLLEGRASEALGRTVTFGASPWVRLGKTVELRIEQVSIANAEWAGETPLARLGKAEVTVDLASLFSGPLLVERLLVEQLHVDLATDADGRSNLPAFAEGESVDRGNEGLPFVLREATLRDVRLTRSKAQANQQLDFVMQSVTQREDAQERLTVEGTGSLQGRDWTMSAEHSGLASLASGRGLSGRVQGSLGDLRLAGEYRLPDVGRLDELALEAEISGTAPPRVAALSPVLETADPLRVRVQTADIDPGISLDATVDIGDLDIRIEGSIDHPGRGDGLDLSIDADAGSLPRLARALGLGATEEVSLTIDGRVRREGRRLEIDRLLVQAGEHRIEGTVRLPLLPGTTDAELDLRGRGPDYGFYQRLLHRPFELNAPYDVDLQLTRATDGREHVEARLEVGTVKATVAGDLGDFPAYTNSSLDISLRGEDLSLLGALVEFELPATAFALEGALAVSDEGRVTTNGLTATAAGANLTLRGGVATYPELDELEARVQLKIPSLATTSSALGLAPLGDVAADLALSATGSLREVSVGSISLRAGEVRAASTTGALQIGQHTLTSDLRFDVDVEALPALLGDYAPERMPSPRLSFSVEPLILDDGYDITIDELRGTQVSGSARLRLGRQRLLDETAHITADLTLDDPAQLLPPIPGYTPRASPLRLAASTRGGQEPRVDLSLKDADTELLRTAIYPASESSPLRISVNGQGDTLRALGDSPYLPAGTQAYRVDGSATITDERIDFTVADLRIGNSELSGGGEIDRRDGSLRSTLDIAFMDLQAWIDAARQATGDTERTTEPAAESQLLIPETPLPLDLLEGPSLDVTLRTGPIGVADPRHPAYPLVNRATLRLLREAPRTTLSVTDLEGSRGTASLDFEALRSAAGAEMSLTLDVAQLPLGMISQGGYDALPRHELDADLEARGSTLRELATTLDGDMLISGGAGTLPKTSVSVVTESFFEQLLLTLLPTLKDQQPDMKVECTVLAARARQGKISLDPGFVIRTERADLSARGEVDLARERLAIRFDNQARRGLGISAASIVNPYVQITGSLKKPTLGLDVASGAIAGGAAVATGGLTVLARPLFGRFLARKNPCEVALERWKETQGA